MNNDSKLSLSMSRLIVFLAIQLSFISALPFATYGAILFADDFELSGWTPLMAGWSDQTDFPNLGITNVPPPGGPFPSGTHAAIAALGTNIPQKGLRRIGMNWTEVYARWFVYYGTGFQWPSDGNSSGAENLFKSQTMSGLPTWVFYSSDAGTNGQTMSPPQATIQTNRWYCLEIHIKRGNPGVFEGWIDDQLKWSNSNLSTGTTYIDRLQLMSALDTNQLVQTQWLDAFAVGDTRIGCTIPIPVLVPDVLTKELSLAGTILSASGFTISVNGTDTSSAQDWMVTAQTPSANTQAAPGTAVSLTLVPIASLPSPQTPASTNTADSGGGGGCYIATAAYGSPLAKEVQLLRIFRDRHLMTNPIGRSAVFIYYKFSPPMANLIGKQELLRSMARITLAPLVWWAKLALYSPALAYLCAVMACVFASVLLYGVLLVARR